MAYEQMKVRITGTATLFMHSNKGINPRHPLAKQLKELTGKRVKTEEDLDMIARLEWELGLYHDKVEGPYLPADMILACMREAAKRTKQGKLVLETIEVDEVRVPLIYDGPRDIESLYAAGDQFFDLRPARVMGRTVNRARPIFTEWAAEFTLRFDAEYINADDVRRILESAGQRTGIGDYRPTHGKFSVAFIADRARKKGA